MTSKQDLLKGANCIQFTFWPLCHLGCDFCFYRYDENLPDTEGKKKKIKEVIAMMKDEKLMTNPDHGKPFDAVGLIGGEFFHNQLDDVEEEWFELIDILNNDDNIEEVWIATSLVYKDRKWLDATIDRLDKKKQLLINTSWDPVGRFPNEKAYQIWEDNVRYLRNKSIFVSCTTILSQRLIDYFYEQDLPEILFDMETLMFFRTSPLHSDKENTPIMDCKENLNIAMATDYQPQNFFIKSRDQFIKFCYDFIEKYGDGPLRYYVNESSHSSAIVPLDGKIVYDRWHIYDTPCKHEYVAQQYLDSDACAYCDVKAILS